MKGLNWTNKSIDEHSFYLANMVTKDHCILSNIIEQKESNS